MQNKKKGIFSWLTPVFVEILGQLIIQGIAEFWFMNRFPDKNVSEISMYAAELTVLTALLLIPLMFFLYRRDAVHGGNVKAEKNLNASTIVNMIITAAGACVLINGLIAVSGVQQLSEAYTETAEALYRPSFAFQMIGLGVIVPLMEELVFRGLMYKRMRRSMSVKKAVIISAFIFGLLHGNLVQFIFAFSIGLLLAYAYELTGNFLIPAVGHISVNITSLVFTEYHIFEWTFEKGIRFVGMIVLSVVLMMSGLQKIRDQNI